MDFIAAHASAILAVPAAVFAFTMIPTVYQQWRAKASTVPLSTSLVTGAMIGVALTVYAALGFWVPLVFGCMNGILWLVVAAQRIIYGSPDNVDDAELEWFGGYLARKTRDERHEYLHQTNSEHDCEAWVRPPRPYVKGTVVCGRCKEDHTPGQLCGVEALRDAAMWVEKNTEEWSDDPAWGGESLETMLGSIDKLREAHEAVANWENEGGA